MNRDMPQSADSGKQEQPKTVTAEHIAEKPKFTPEETETIQKVSAELKAENDMLSGELEGVMMTPPIANEDKVKTLLAEYIAAEKSGDRQLQAEAHKKFDQADKEHKSRTYRVDFLKGLINQNEIKMGLAPERKLALGRLKSFKDKYPGIMTEDRSGWIDRPGQASLHDDPIQFQEDGSCTVDGLNLESKDKEKVASMMSEMPEGVTFKECFVKGGDMLEFIPKKIGKLGLRPAGIDSPEKAKAYAEQVKTFLQAEREVDEISSTGENPEVSVYGAGMREFRTTLETLPPTQIKLQIGHDQNGYPKGRAFSTDTGNTPLNGYLNKSFPKQAK